MTASGYGFGVSALWFADFRAVEDLARYFCLTDLEPGHLLVERPGVGWLRLAPG
jgi:hypothetical protein